MKINFVLTQDLKSQIFYDIFRRYVDNTLGMDVIISEKPEPGADIYHYHRVHLEETLVQPAVMTVHHDPVDADPWLEPEKFYRHYRQAAMVVCLNSLQQQHLKALGIPNCCVIPHGYDAALFSKKPLRTFDPNRKIVLGFTSRRYSRRFKGEVLLYEIMHRIDPERFSFFFVGQGRHEDANIARNAGFDVTVFEYLPYPLYPKVYEKIDFLLMVSNFEGGPANLPEAVSSGTPIIGTRIGMAADLIQEGVNGMFVSRRSPGKAEQLFADIACNANNIYDRLVEGAHRLNTAITWDEVIAMHARMYADLIGSDHRAALSA
jgi:glycosyltransferase involved in cell wall biosynthesis